MDWKRSDETLGLAFATSDECGRHQIGFLSAGQDADPDGVHGRVQDQADDAHHPHRLAH